MLRPFLHRDAAKVYAAAPFAPVDENDLDRGNTCLPTLHQENAGETYDNQAHLLRAFTSLVLKGLC